MKQSHKPDPRQPQLPLLVGEIIGAHKHQCSACGAQWRHHTERCADLLIVSTCPLCPNDSPADEVTLRRVAEVTERSIARVTSNANPAWIETIYQVVCALARTRPVLTADDVWQQIDALDNLPPQREPSALGAVFRRAVREKILALVADEYRESQRPEAHRRPMRVWRSLIYTENRTS